jgi:hypothetical protein
MKRFVLLIIVVVVVAFGQALPVNAAIIEISPRTGTVDLGDSVSVDIVVSDRTGTNEEAISGFDFDVAYDDTMITLTDASFGTQLGDPLFDSFTDTSYSESGLQDFYQFSYLSDADLIALQSEDSFILASMTFDAIGVGSTDLMFVGDWLELLGLNYTILDPTYVSSSITIVDGSVNAIPELDPNAAGASLLLLIGGVMVLAERRRRT